ncbi:OLC1v1018125C4 [Oldenlandia corymbosa var. corymbosa]|uniref:OLC1v1018125C4 n=2 Tax=Oldenlandia corymbosa var. corymbosa TaxID=529605 RepID=A0AAV1EAX8_OLDCO|nr:OLC1v1018125C4 [Oldenlandia corymbosa var. corymbosa]
MGALAPLTHWLPQDDLLLKNAVEAGASLEALAKGAVKFSRRFSLQELQNRWRSLLYDPVIATEASDRMIESEPLGSKETDCTSSKRKAESIRECYYRMMKRIRSEPLYSMDLSLLDLPGFDIIGSECIPTNCLIGDQVSKCCETQDQSSGAEKGSHIDFGTNGATSPINDLSASALSTDKENMSLGQSNHVQEVRLPEKNVSLTEDHLSNGELSPSEELLDLNLLESVSLEVQQQGLFSQTNDSEAIVFSGYGCQVINSSIPGSPTSLENVGYGSPVLQMPLLDTANGIADSPVLQMPLLDTANGIDASTADDACLVNNVPHADTDLQIVDGVDIGNNGGVNLISGYMVELPLNAEDHSPAEVTCGNLEKLAPSAKEYFEQLSNSLLTFTPEDEIFLLDADGKEIIDNLSSLLLDFPSEDLQVLDVSEASVASQECFDISIDAPPEESYTEEQYHCDQRQVWSADVQKLSSALTVNPLFPEWRNGVICCMLNTEDTEIPNNDDVFLPINLTSTSISWMENAKCNEAFYSVSFSVEEFEHNCKPVDRFMVRGERTTSKELSGPRPVKGQLQGPICQHNDNQLLGPICQQNDNGQRFELPGTDVQQVFTKDYSDLSIITQVSKTDITPGSLSESLMQVEQAKELNDISGGSQKHSYYLDTCLTFQEEAAVCNPEEDHALDQNNDVTIAKLDSTTKTVPEQSIDCTLSDQEVFSNESESELPCFSDVEAMINDMDLSPDEFPVVRPEVAERYQEEGERKTILRLEQAAEACVQRSLAARGAFAVLYSRRSEYPVKKPEVLLGRGTEDVKVDIDLGREFHANKISRRQATLKLEADGTFHLRNHGKAPIFVNGEVIMPENTFLLKSGCLIEIRGLAFLFEVNKKLCELVNCLN